MTDPNYRVLAAILRRQLYSFVQLAFERLEPSEVFRQTQATRLICATLEEVAAGRVRRQVINQPPRTLKSFISSVCFPAWLLANDPGIRIALVCHDLRLVQDLADRCRQILRSDWFQEMFPSTRLRIDAAEKMQFKTTEGGGVFAASMTSGLTGHGADVIIIDDPIDAGDVHSEVERSKVNNLFDGKIASRLNSQAEGRIVIVAQRLHWDDLCGHLKERSGFQHLVVPLVAEGNIIYDVGTFEWQRPEGDIIDPGSYPPEQVERLKQDLPAHVFQAQYQQAPVRLDGGIVKAEWFQRYGQIPHAAHRVIISCDCGQTVGETSSFSSALVFRTDGANHYLIDILRKRAGIIELREDMLRLCAQHHPASILVEDAALGSSLIEILREKRLPVVAIPRPTRSKVERLEAVLFMISSGMVLLPDSSRGWMDAFLSELCAFPGGSHDDQVDALTQYLGWVAAPDRPRHPPMLASGLAPTVSGRPGMGRPWTPHPMRNPQGPPRMPPIRRR